MLLNHLVFANPNNTTARGLLADIYTQLGYQAESGPWRNFYLSGANELRNKPNPDIMVNLLKPSDADFLNNLNNMTPEMLFDYISIKIDGKKAADENMIINIRFSNLQPADYNLILSNGALTNRVGSHTTSAVSINAQKNNFESLLLHPEQLDEMISDGRIGIAGNKNSLVNFLSLIDFNPVYFNIVEP
jgi:alkyl sulfatase BDS1-like metallo-beta-lactamase superfamily hydrolase